MRRKIKTLLLGLMILAIISVSIIANADIKNTTYQKNESYNQFETFKYDDRPTLKIEKHYPEEVIQETESHYRELTNVIPYDIRARLKSANVVVHYVEDCHDYASNLDAFVIGFYEPGKNRIFISFASIDTATYHELGHAVAYVYGNLDCSKEYREAYNLDKEIGGLLVSLAKDRFEAFADMFSAYIDCLAPNPSDKNNYESKAFVLESGKNIANYMRDKLNLPSIDEGYAYRCIKVSKYSILLKFRHFQKIEIITTREKDCLKTRFVALKNIHMMVSAIKSRCPNH